MFASVAACALGAPGRCPLSPHHPLYAWWIDSCIAWIFMRPASFRAQGAWITVARVRARGSNRLQNKVGLGHRGCVWSPPPGVLQQQMNICCWNTDPQSGQSEAGVRPVFRLAKKRRLSIGHQGANGSRRRDDQENGRPPPSRGGHHWFAYL